MTDNQTAKQDYLKEDYSAKDAGYFSSARRDLVERLPNNPNAAILELGCGNGATGALAKQCGKCGFYAGIEMFHDAASEAKLVLDRVLVGDVATIELDLPKEHFDILICSEVLEHLVDPARVLAELMLFMKPGALVLASSPNIAHYRIIYDLIRGRFEYCDFGAMDRTHLRWFTPASYTRLFEEAGVTTVRTYRLSGKRTWSVAAAEILPRRVAHMLWYQIGYEGRVRETKPPVGGS